MNYTIAKRGLWITAMLALCAACSVPKTQPVPTPQGASIPVPIAGEAPQVPTLGAIPPGTPTVKVAFLVPLSGDSASVGQAMLDAATIALYDNYLSVPSEQIRAQVVLVPKDSGNTAADAARAAQQAIEQGATFIVGPLFSQAVTAVAPIARAKNVKILTFSNNKAVAGGGVYVFGFLPEQQVLRMAEFAFLRNYTRVALLAPNDAYGQKIQEVLTAAYAQKGGTVVPAELYAPNQANIDAAVNRLAAYNNANLDRRFQAVFIADSGPQLKNIIASFKKTNIDLSKIKLLGTGLWDDPEIAKIPEMSGAWFSSSPPEDFRDFERRFFTTYGYKPVRLASLAYDAVTLVALLTLGDPYGLNSTTLTNPAGFQSPANGLVRLLPDGTSDRRLSVMEITSSGPKTIDIAPKDFDQK